MTNNEAIIKVGHVESVEDKSDGLRIKVRLDQDKNTPLNDLPYAFPLLPKILQCVPKVGEGALVINQTSGNKFSQRYYIGPIISQPQYQEMCNYAYGTGDASSLFNGGEIEPLERLSNFGEMTKGSFPEVNDIAMVGRDSQDLIMKHNQSTSDEIDIRCGIRKDAAFAGENNNESLRGKVIYNSIDPAYIQLKYREALTTYEKQASNSMVNVVADKINIISNQDANHFNLTNTETLISEEELDDIMSKLHRLPYGDELVKLLSLMINAIISHVHPYNGMPPVIHGYTQQIAEYNLEKILSEHVRIS